MKTGCRFRSWGWVTAAYNYWFNRPTMAELNDGDIISSHNIYTIQLLMAWFIMEKYTDKFEHIQYILR